MRAGLLLFRGRRAAAARDRRGARQQQQPAVTGRADVRSTTAVVVLYVCISYVRNKSSYEIILCIFRRRCSPLGLIVLIPAMRQSVLSYKSVFFEVFVIYVHTIRCTVNVACTAECVVSTVPTYAGQCSR